MTKLIIFMTVTIFSAPATYAAVFSCGKMSAAEFSSAVADNEKKFKALIKSKTDENKGKPEADEKTAAAIHDFIVENESALVGLLLWPELTEGKLFYHRAFLRCGQAGRQYLKTLSSQGANHTELVEWKQCMKELYRDDKPNAAIELDQCFSKFERKK